MRRFLALCLLAFTFCSTPVPIRFGAHQSPAPVVSISNPYLMQGDAIAGRRAFIDSKCVDCHKKTNVAGK